MSILSLTSFKFRLSVVYQFTCLCDTNLTCIGKTKRHLITRAREHLSLGNIFTNSEVKTHLESCHRCQEATPETCFRILKSCGTDFQARVHEALLIKKHNPRLNKKLFNKGSFFTLKIFWGLRLFQVQCLHFIWVIHVFNVIILFPDVFIIFIILWFYLMRNACACRNILCFYLWTSHVFY